MTGQEWSVKNVQVCILAAIRLLMCEQQWDESSDRYLVKTCLSEMERLAEEHPEIRRAIPHVQGMYDLMLRADGGTRRQAVECGKTALAEWL